MRTEVVKARPRHIVDLIQNMRTDDVNELAVVGLTPATAWTHYKQSVLCRAFEVDNETAVVWGVVGDLFGGFGELWMLTTPAVERAPKAFVTNGRQQVNEFLSLYHTLAGLFVHTYRGARRYAETLGFTIIEGEPLCAFIKERD